MKEIQLTQGKTAIVDDDDYEWLSKNNWYVTVYGYAVRKPYSGKGKSFYMHREIMKTPYGMETDHINGNKLDNRKENLRICSKFENMQNRHKQNNNTSGYKGVFYSIPAKRWRAQIVVNRQSIHLGLFDTTLEAAKAYNDAALQYFGEFAKLNEI